MAVAADFHRNFLNTEEKSPITDMRLHIQMICVYSFVIELYHKIIRISIGY